MSMFLAGICGLILVVLSEAKIVTLGGIIKLVLYGLSIMLLIISSLMLGFFPYLVGAGFIALYILFILKEKEKS